MMRLKDKIASGLGSVLEWYDFALYGYFAPIIAKLYFPNQAHDVALLKVFSVFAVGFFARPLGAVIFGLIGDKHGRIVSLKMMPILMTIPTISFSFLPTYQQIGIDAPILLVMIRIFQGIFIGGEYANNIVYLCETTNSKYHYFMGSIGSCTGSFGLFIASGIASICYWVLPNQDLLSWGWRIAFSLSILIGIATYNMRKNMLETPIFNQLINKNSMSVKPIKESFKYQGKDYLVSFGLLFLPAIAFYYVFMFLPNFLETFRNDNYSNILSDNSWSLFARFLIIPFLGLLADKIGAINMARLAALLFILFSYPLLQRVISGHTLSPLFILILAMFTTINAATTPGLLINLLQPKTRCTIFSLVFNISFGVFGGLVPVISVFLVEMTGNKLASIPCLIIAAFVTFVSTFFYKKEGCRD